MSALEGEGAAPAPAKPTKYDITIEHGDGKIPFVLGQMPGRPVGAKLNKILDNKYASVAQVDDILVAVNKTIVLKLGVHNILSMLDELRRSQKKSHKPIVCRFVYSDDIIRPRIFIGDWNGHSLDDISLLICCYYLFALLDHVVAVVIGKILFVGS